MKKINISTKTYPNTFTLVDDEDYDYLMQWKWYALYNKKSNVFYACRNGRDIRGKQFAIRVHRFIISVTDTMLVDHRNHNGLDNRKNNLRVCTQSQNLRNSKIRQHTTSKYKGVSWHKRDKLWCAYIYIDNKLKHIGNFLNEKKAALAYNKAAKKYFKEYAFLNNL